MKYTCNINYTNYYYYAFIRFITICIESILDNNNLKYINQINDYNNLNNINKLLCNDILDIVKDYLKPKNELIEFIYSSETLLLRNSKRLYSKLEENGYEIVNVELDDTSENTIVIQKNNKKMKVLILFYTYSIIITILEKHFICNNLDELIENIKKYV